MGLRAGTSGQHVAGTPETVGILVVQCAEEEVSARPCRGTRDCGYACSKRRSVRPTSSQAEGEHPVEHYGRFPPVSALNVTSNRLSYVLR